MPLKSDKYLNLLKKMYGDRPNKFSNKLPKKKVWLFTVNTFTRMRFCYHDLKHNRPDKTRFVFGHWSSLGLYQKENVIGIDTGCVWGQSMTLYDIEKDIFILNMIHPDDIGISIETEFLEAQSKPKDNKYVFSYTITIVNDSSEQVQLLSRHWLIKDANFKVEEVIGEGVVGEKPILDPQAGYQYSSGAILETEVGTMEGFYHFQGKNEEYIKVPIPKFILSIPRQLH